jgi:hypothetical protein
MSSFAHYCYQMPWGFMTCEVGVDEPPTEFVDRWGVNITESRMIAQGGEVFVDDDGRLVVVPSVAPNDGTP